MRLVNGFRNLPMAVKIALFGLISSFAFFALMSLTVQSSIFNSLLAYSQSQARIEAGILQSQFAIAENRLVQATSALSMTPGLADALKSAAPQQLKAALGAQTATLKDDLVRVVTPQGETLFDSQTMAVSLDAAALSELLLAMGDSGAATGLIGSAAGEDRAVFLVAMAEINDAAGVIIGAISVGRRIDSAFMTDLRLGRAETHLNLYYDSQVITTSGTQTKPAGTIDIDMDLITQAERGQVVVAPTRITGATDIPLVEVYAPAVVGGDTAAVFVLQVKYATLFDLRDSLLQNLRTGGLIVLFLISNLIIVLIQNGITRPIVRLTQQIEPLIKGDYSQRVVVSSKDEIGRLGASFNLMTDAVQHREVDLKALNQTLEQRVADRTRDLLTARDEAVAAQRLAQESSRLKSEFLSTMSHELRTPLNAIEGFSGIMLSGMGVELSPIAEGMMKRISGNSKRLLYLINDFLDLSRIEAGRLELVYEALDIRLLVERWRESVSVLAEEKRLAFNITIDPSVPEKIVNDEDALTKIVINLLSNAFKFTRQGWVGLTLEARDSRLFITVTDTGIGIPLHAREYIFEEFRQVDGSSKREYGGTGLGLALVSKLARLLNGTVTLESEVGKGSAFTIELPLQHEGIVS